MWGDRLNQMALQPLQLLCIHQCTFLCLQWAKSLVQPIGLSGSCLSVLLQFQYSSVQQSGLKVGLWAGGVISKKKINKWKSSGKDSGCWSTCTSPDDAPVCWPSCPHVAGTLLTISTAPVQHWKESGDHTGSISLFFKYSFSKQYHCLYGNLPIWQLLFFRRLRMPFAAF